MDNRAVRQVGMSLLAAAVLLMGGAAPAAAQDDPNPGGITLSGGLDFSSAYMFRGIKQETEGLVMWPYLDLGLALYEGEGSLKTFGVNVGTWNSLHAGGDLGTNGPSRELWYESDWYVTFGFGLPGGVTAGMTYTAYTSPNDSFTTIKELAFKVAVDDAGRLGRFAVRPYALVAAEVDTSSGVGQADGGSDPGRYMEFGIAPGYTASRFSVSVPVKAGLSLSDYYEHPVTREDDTFGYASLAGIVTVPLTPMSTTFGSWNVHGGVEVQKLNKTARALYGELNDDGGLESWKAIYSVGLGFSY